MRSKWRIILFHPFIVGVVISAFAIFLFAKYYPKYSVSILDETELNNNGEVYYADLNNDGESEKIHYYHYDRIFPPTLYLYDSKGNFKFLWNFSQSPLKGSSLFFGDYNGDNKSEIYLFTQSSDSIFIHVLNSEDDKTSIISGEFLLKAQNLNDNFRLIPIGLHHLNSNKTRDFLFAIDAGYPVTPNRIYCFNIESKELISSPELNVAISSPIVVDDIDNNGTQELFISNKSVEIGNTTQSQFIVLDHTLRYLFEPISYSGTPSQTTVDIIHTDDRKEIAVLNSSTQQETVFNNLMIFSPKGELLKEIGISEKSNLSFTGTQNNQGEFYLISDKKAYLFGSDFTEIKNIRLNNDLKSTFLNCIDLNCDHKKELIFINQQEILILSDDFNQKSGIKCHTQLGKVNLSFLKSIQNPTKVSIQVKEKVFLLDYLKKETVYNSQFFYIIIFIIITLTVFLIFKIKHFKIKDLMMSKEYDLIMNRVEDGISDRLSGLKNNLQNLKDNIDTDSFNKVIEEIDYSFEQVKNISHRARQESNFTQNFAGTINSLIQQKQKLINITHYIFPEDWDEIKLPLKDFIINFIENISTYVQEISDDIQINIHFVKHDDFISILCELEKVLLSAEELQNRLFLKNLNSIGGTFNVDNPTDYGTIINLVIPIDISSLDKTAEKNRIKIIIAEDHDVSLFGLTSLFKTKDDMEIVGTARNGMEVLKLLETQVPDIVITDISMPGMDGIELSEKLQKEYPKIKVIVFTMYMENWFIEQLLNHGAMAFVSKSSKTTELISAVRNVFEGKNYYCHQFKSKFGFRGSNGIAGRLDSLTKNEMQIVKYYANDMDKKEIAINMHVNEKTIESFVANIMLKIHAGDEEEIVRIAKKQKFISV